MKTALKLFITPIIQTSRLGVLFFPIQRIMRCLGSQLFGFNFLKTKNMKTTLSLFVSLNFVLLSLSQNTVTSLDFKSLDQTSWSGSLMYINYGDGKEVQLRTTMQIEVTENKIKIKTQYIDEPGANSAETIKIKKEGAYLGNEKIIEKTKDKDGRLKLVTMFKGKEANKAVTMYKTYLFDSNQFSISKEVQVNDSDEKFIRNTYNYKRITS